ncbi:MAG: toll/interleukin-1 receptor domain-containing protein, partial [Pseudomonadota bacterium]
MSSQHPSIFLSYARVDKPDVERVADTLAAAGLDVFWDKHLDPGSFQEQLEFHLETCDAFVVIVGEHGVSGWVNAETRVALARHFSRAAKRLTIVPLLLGRTSPGDLPSFLRLFQTTHLNDVRDAAEAAGFATEIRHHAFSTKDVAKPKEPVTECPYPGLGTFNAENQPYFFGRDNEVVGALDAFSTPDDLSGPRRWLRIEGTSGVGKSSLLRAGLLPALRQGWGDFGNPLTRLQEVGIMRPGNAPLNALARLLATAFKRRSEDLISRFATPNFQLSHLFVEQALGHEARTLPLLVIDQFEELFTVAADNPEQRERFDRLLAESVADPQCPLYLITTMRSDFVGAFDELPYLSQRRASAAQYELLPISAAGLEDVLEQSVALAGLDYSDAQLAKDVYQDALHNGLIEPGALPLVSNVLRLMWDDRKDGLLQRRTYDALNGLGGAIATQADRLLDSLPTTDQHRVR